MTVELSEPRTTSYGRSGPLGSTLPRLYTPPLVTGPPGPCGCGCALDETTSDGFDVAEFAAETLGMPLDEWERWAVIHGLELLPDGRPRFRKLLLIVARQNGKTHLLVVLALFWLFVDLLPMVLGTSTNLGYAKISWEKAVELARATPDLAGEIARVRQAAGEETLVTSGGAKYRIAAANENGGRSLTIHRLILDELRQHYDWSAWNASYNAMNAVSHGQAWGITNQGGVRAVVLQSLRDEAIDPTTDTVRPLDERDPRLGVFEWSAPPGTSADDPQGLAAANPNLNRHSDRGPWLEDLLADARRAMRSGGDELAQFLTEVLCMRVTSLNPAYDIAQWRRPAAEGGCLLPGPLLDDMRGRMAWVFDVSLDGSQATLCAAAKDLEGKVRAEPVRSWDSPAAMRRDLPVLIRKHRPRVVGWFQNGPAAAVAAEVAKRTGWPPAGVTFEPLQAEAHAVCMGLGELIDAGDVLQPGDEGLDVQIEAAERKVSGDRWVLTRRGTGPVDGAYAFAGAVHLARTMPTPVGKPRLIVARKSSATDA